ncbi:MAG TPA: FAD-binding oxidoreductase [Polyangiaceae bacterium]|jgi:decaprenylphospho-beta-D-ribofuranose 2-oxidase|nr:FAD-binding oxidoreductase [Polyangiaceae bacterium]
MRLSRRDLLAAIAASVFTPACGKSSLGKCCANWALPEAALPPPELLPLCGVPVTRERIFAFDEIRYATPTVYRPKNAGDIASILCFARQAHRRVTVRGGGNSFDGQSLNDDIVIQMGKGFAHVGCPDQDDHGFFIEVGAAATWWDVLKKLAPLGLFPPSMATAGSAMVGGTLSADCVSRMSCTTGKEGAQVRWFEMVLMDGSTVACLRNDPDADRQRLFNAVIGGFGYLGIITKVCFDLMVVRSYANTPGENPVVLTRSTRYGSFVDWDELLLMLNQKGRQSRIEYERTRDRSRAAVHDPSKAMAPAWPALSIPVFLSGPGLGANLFEQGFGDHRPLKRTPGGVFTTDSNFIAEAEYATSWFPTLIEFAVDLGCPQGEFVDELFGWAFFLGNSTSRAKANAHCANPRERLNFNQQSFALPAGPNEDAPDTRATRRFMELLVGRLHACGLRPVDIDLLYVPPDEFLMSASNNLPSYLVTIAFSNVNAPVMPAVLNDFLCDASRDCRLLGGRVHLVKNIVADPADLRAMYGDAAREMLRLKSAYDPTGVLRNEFFGRVFET